MEQKIDSLQMEVNNFNGYLNNVYEEQKGMKI